MGLPPAVAALPVKRPVSALAAPLSPVAFCVSEPWDLLRGLCVFKDRARLVSQLSSSSLCHFAPNCATFSRAREIPIPHVKSPPRPLRSEAFPEGIPHEVSKMSRKAAQRLQLGTEMAQLSARECMRAHAEGRAFTLEHPARSIALNLPSWKELAQSPGVEVIPYTTCMFAGSRRRKRQVLICNRPYFQSMHRVCTDPRLCSRTGERHLKWRPAVAIGKVLQFTTGDEREYPVGFCEAYAECLELQAGGVFTEVFSGPNAPLSAAVCRRIGQQLPGQRVESSRGVTNELQHLAQLVQGKPASLPSPVPCRSARAETSFYRLSTLEAGRQPGYGKRTQLIADGLTLHLKEALKLAHPFRGSAALKEDHVTALEEASVKAGAACPGSG